MYINTMKAIALIASGCAAMLQMRFEKKCKCIIFVSHCIYPCMYAPSPHLDLLVFGLGKPSRLLYWIVTDIYISWSLG